MDAINDKSRLEKSAYFLIPIMALAFFMAFIPHMSDIYPVHIDEWVHIAHNNELLKTGDLPYPDPFSGGKPVGWNTTLESGFHVLFSVFYKISGLSWIDITRYFPGIIFVLTILSVYILARRERFGWEAAFFTCLIPTTVGLMGPAFFIPVALCLLFIPLSLFLVFYHRSFWSYLILLIFVAFLIITHATSAICLVLILIPGIMLYLIKEPRHGLILLLMGVIPFLVTLPWTYKLIASTAQSLLTPQPLPTDRDLPMILLTYGYIPCIIGLVGIFWQAFKGGVKNYSLVLALLILVAMLAVFYTLHYGVTMVYLRGQIFTLLILSIIAGAGLMAIKQLKLPDTLHLPGFARRIGYPLTAVLIAVILTIAIPARQNTSYYHMIDDEDYQTFVWIRDNIDASYRKGILDPWKATPFTAITKKYVYARDHNRPTSLTKTINNFFSDNCTDTDFLRRNNISLVYTRGSCSNPDLVEVHQWVYVLKEP